MNCTRPEIFSDRRLPAAALLAAGALLPLYAGASESCSRGVVCVEAREEGDRVELWGRQLATYDITLTLTATLANMAADGPLPLTRTLPPGFTGRLLTLRARDPGRDVSWDYGYAWVRGRRDARHDGRCVYILPYAVGARQFVTQGWNGAVTHTGENRYAVDFDLPEGAMVYAARAGVVTGVMTEYAEGGRDERLKAEANFVIVRHADGTDAEYLHFQRDGVQVGVGQRITAGSALGFSGRIGYTGGPHLHFMVYRAVDGYRRESIPVRFATVEEGITALRQGRGYTRPR